MLNKKIITLMVMTPFLAEMVSANSSVIALLNPLFLILQIISYGVPIILIREAVIKWNLGLRGLFLLGIAYGFLNEGVFARTFAFTETLLGTTPASHFILGINPFWVTYVSIWHAFYAVIFPIFIIQYLYKDNQSWLSKVQTKWFVGIMVVETLVSLIVGKSPETVLSIIGIIILIFVARKQKSKILVNDNIPSKRSFIIGLLFILYTILSIMLAKAISIIPFVIFEILGLVVFYYLLKAKQRLSSVSFLLFGIGAYITLGIFAAIITFNPIVMIPNLIVATILSIFAYRILKEGKSQNTISKTALLDL